jgi:hypothetical protein
MSISKHSSDSGVSLGLQAGESISFDREVGRAYHRRSFHGRHFSRQKKNQNRPPRRRRPQRPRGVPEFQKDGGYSDVLSHPKSPTGDALTDALGGAFFVGIRSATQLTAAVLDRAPKLIGIGCFCIGTNQVC